MKNNQSRITYAMTILMLCMISSPLAMPSGAAAARASPCTASICLNAVMPNPNGYDDAAWPGGDWAEVKNTGAVAVSVLNWQLQNSNGKTLDFDANSIVGYNSSNSSTWTIQPGAWMVVARNADTNFWMTNTQDAMSLYDANSSKVDEASWGTAGSGVSYIEDPTDA